MTKDKKTGKMMVTKAEADLLEKAKQRQASKEKRAEHRTAKKAQDENANPPNVCEAFYKAVKPGQFIRFRNREVPGREFIGLTLTKGKKDLKGGTRYEFDVLLQEPTAGKAADFKESGADQIHTVYGEEVVGIGNSLEFPKIVRNTVKLPKVKKAAKPKPEPATAATEAPKEKAQPAGNAGDKPPKAAKSIPRKKKRKAASRGRIHK